MVALGACEHLCATQLSVDVPALGTGFAGVRFRYFHDNHVLLLGLKLQELFCLLLRVPRLTQRWIGHGLPAESSQIRGVATAAPIG